MEQLRCTLDYETTSQADLKAKGAIEYARDPSTAIFCLGYKIGGADSKLWIPERAPMPKDLWEVFQHGVLVAHNVSFERAITKYTLTRYSCLSDEQKATLWALPISRWRCTAAKAAACSLPRKLEGAAGALELKTQKDKEGHRLILKYSKPRRPSKHDPSSWWHDKKELRKIYKYCLTDVNAEFELDQALPDLIPFEQIVWELDQKINDRGVLIDIPTVKKILGMIKEETANIKERVIKLANGKVDSVTKIAKVLAWLNAQGAEMENLQAPTIRDKLLETDLDDKIKLMLEYRQGGSKTSTAKYMSMVKAVGEDNRARELLLYCGAATTGRWAGKRVQPQNFPKSTIAKFDSDEAIRLIQAGGLHSIRLKYGRENAMKVLVSVIRGMIIASPGCEFYCADFSSIEARITFWLAEHEEGLQAFRDGRKLYEEMASNTFGIPIEEVTKDSLERFIGKESVLGAGFGIGWAAFLRNCHKKGMPNVTPEIAKKAVYAYRKTHWPVPQLWKDLEQAAIRAILQPNTRHQVTKVMLYVKGGFLNIKLPSGRRLRYFKPRVSQKQLAGGRMVPQIHHWAMNNTTHQWEEVVTWGGVIVANCVQSIARDLMANAMLNIENAGYDVCLSIHDECLSEIKKGCGDLKAYVKLMTALPDWATGCPITAEGWKGLRYRK